MMKLKEWLMLTAVIVTQMIFDQTYAQKYSSAQLSDLLKGRTFNGIMTLSRDVMSDSQSGNYWPRYRPLSSNGLELLLQIQFDQDFSKTKGSWSTYLKNPKTGGLEKITASIDLYSTGKEVVVELLEPQMDNRPIIAIYIDFELLKKTDQILASSIIPSNLPAKLSLYMDDIDDKWLPIRTVLVQDKIKGELPELKKYLESLDVEVRKKLESVF